LNEKSSGSRSRKQRLTAVGTRCADHVTPLNPQKLALTSPTGGGRSVGTVRLRTKATEFSLVFSSSSSSSGGSSGSRRSSRMSNISGCSSRINSNSSSSSSISSSSRIIVIVCGGGGGSSSSSSSSTVERHLSGLIGTARHSDKQKIRITGFFSKIGYIGTLKCEKISINGRLIHIYLPTYKTLIHN